MKLANPTADIFVPDGQPVAAALARVTHLGIGAHSDDLEFMAFHGIAHCYRSQTASFGGVTCTDGAGSARTGPFAGHTDAQLRAERRREQVQAATIGRYGIVLQLDYPSASIKQTGAKPLTDDLTHILRACRPKILYTHNPADKHETHIAVLQATLRAIRALPADQRPGKVYGCEIWRDLDWLPDDAKVILDVSGHDDLARQLNAVFATQIAGGKRYDLAVEGRRRANATFLQSHATDQIQAAIFAVDLTPLIHDDTRDVSELIAGHIQKFAEDVRTKLARFTGRGL